MFDKKGALKNITKLSGKLLHQNPLLNKVAAYKEILAQVFPVNITKLKNIFFYRTPLMAASGKNGIKSSKSAKFQF